MGLFMNEGPYVQVKNGNGKIETLKSKTNTPIWTGPLVIMQNEISASASEILGGMVQDYGRGIVVGSPQSYGKGTVQTFVDLNRFLSTNDDFGSLKLTIQKFYRVTGESTQKKGIEADVKMNDLFTHAEIGERYDDYALAWDKIQPAAFNRITTLDIATLQKNSATRLAKDKDYQLLQESAKWREALNKEESITLNETKFNEVMKERKTQIKKFESLIKLNNGLKFIRYNDELAREKTDDVFKKKSENWVKNLQRDLYLKETVNIISEMK
ncbi:hypothetical protein BPO_1196 [Bergeyella porcorum]|uniref:Tail specific protease domain-containing protein n=1 Tax=Bergeyella porcorum TaxID=1735111 RepID=A0AAU0F4Y2_9FLAO